MTKKDLALALGISASMVSRLIKRGMPVDVERAKRWRRRHIEPGRMKGVRHDPNAECRPVAVQPDHDELLDDDPVPDDEDAAGEPAAQPGVNKRFQAARALREEYLALAAQTSHERTIGVLRDAAEVEAIAARAASELRQRMESIAPVLAPKLVGLTDEAVIYGRIHAEVEQALEAAAAHFLKLASALGPEEAPDVCAL